MIRTESAARAAPAAASNFVAGDQVSATKIDGRNDVPGSGSGSKQRRQCGRPALMRVPQAEHTTKEVTSVFFPAE
jgi:hypothetical protein